MSDGSPIEFSMTIGALAKALSEAQGQIQDAKKDAVNPHFKNKYATLSSVREAITPAFAKTGLSVAQYFEPHGMDAICIVTLLMHSSGEWIKSRLVLPVSKKDAQGFGSAVSYGRRYALAAIANIASDEDDDAEAATTKPAAKAAPAPAATSAVDVDALCKALDDASDENALAQAVLAIGRVKDKLKPAELKRCQDRRDENMRRIQALVESAAQ